MAFSVPTFNLLVNIWRRGSGPPAAPDVVASGNLAYSRRVQAGDVGGLANAAFLIQLLVPVGTDVRANYCYAGGGLGDWVEVPAGTGRLYAVYAVDDSGKGFSNEHRVATISPTTNFGLWPSPIP